MGGGGGGPGTRELDQTPTWAVSAVCAVIVMISIALEKVLHWVAKVFHEKHKKAMLEALEKLKGELMILGFISLLLTFGQPYISRVCIAEKAADTMLPCPPRTLGHDGAVIHKNGHGGGGEGGESHRRLLWNERRILGGGGQEGSVPLITAHGVHQLHIFIFFLAVFHVMYSAVTMALGRMKIREWKVWEQDAAKDEETVNDPTRFRLTHQTSFVRDHTSVASKSPIIFYPVCFFQQFYRSVGRVDYLTMRHGFVTVHLAPGSNFDFQKYIKRSLEDDFKVVVGISPFLWASMVIFLTLNVHGWETMFWLSILPLILILAVGTKLQAIISKMAIEIQEKHAVVQGIPLVQVSDRHFWFSSPKFILHLLHFILFQNAFEITYFFWIWYEFGLKSCFNSNMELLPPRVIIGVAVQLLCSYVTLPLYALVSQMGSTMKLSIFDEQTTKGLKKWREHAVKKNSDGKGDQPTITVVVKTVASPIHSPTSARSRTHSRARTPDRGFENVDL